LTKSSFRYDFATTNLLVPEKQLRQSRIDAIIFQALGHYSSAQLRLTVGLAKFVSFHSQTSPSRRTLAAILKQHTYHKRRKKIKKL